MKVYEKLNNYIRDKKIDLCLISKRTGISSERLIEILNGKIELKVEEFVDIVISLNKDANYFINLYESYGECKGEEKC